VSIEEPDLEATDRNPDEASAVRAEDAGAWHTSWYVASVAVYSGR
jgi:hypothetical protein